MEIQLNNHSLNDNEQPIVYSDGFINYNDTGLSIKMVKPSTYDDRVNIIDTKL